MTKARTNGQKLADKRRRSLAGAGLPGLAGIPRREKQARNNGRFAKVEDDPCITALSARCTRLGIAPDQKGMDIVKGQHMCCDIGFVLEATCRPDERAKLWDVFHRWTRAEVTYRVRYIGQREQPASAALMMVHDRMETDPSLTVDVRDDDQRDRDAVNGWMRWQGFLGHLPKEQTTILHCARRGDGPVLWQDKRATAYGLAAVEALRGLAEVSERKQNR